MRKKSYDVSIVGLNFDRLLREFNRLNITLYNLKKPNYKTMEFSLSFFDYKKFKKIKILSNYEVSVTKKHGLVNLLGEIMQHLALIISGAACVIMFLIFSNFTLKINVLGLNSITEDEIIEQLKQFNVKTNQINTKSNEDIEKFLKQNNDKISLVSVIKKGTNLIVNIQEKIQLSTDTTPITAPYNMQITKLNVKQGTTTFKVGDIIKKGDVIVSAVTVLSDGTQVELEPIAEIEGTTWISGTVTFETNQVNLVKTGKRKSVSYYELNGIKLFYKTPVVKFEKFEKVVYNDYVFPNWFLPLKYVRTTFYELKEETVTQSFDDNKERLTNESKTLAYKNLPSGKKVEEENTVINSDGDKYFVTTYLKINITLWGTNANKFL